MREFGKMAGRILLPILLGAALLAGCEAREVALCERFIRATLGAESGFQRLDLSVAERRLTPLEAQRAVYPNFDPNTAYPRRPGRTDFILDALATFPAYLREVTIRFAARVDGRERRMAQSCRFLRLGGTTQFVRERDLARLLIDRALAEHGDPHGGCCIRRNREVR